MSRGAVPVSKAYSLSAQTAVVALEAGRHRAHGFQLCPFSRRGAWGGDKKMCSHIGFGEEEGCEGSVKNVTDRQASRRCRSGADAERMRLRDERSEAAAPSAQPSVA